MEHNTRPKGHFETLRRSALPAVLFIPDIALALQLADAEAEEVILSGDFGPHFRVTGRVAMRRESFVAAMVGMESLNELPPARLQILERAGNAEPPVESPDKLKAIAECSSTASDLMTERGGQE